MVGANPYQPGFFWIGAGALVVGAVLEIAARPTQQTVSMAQPTGERLVIPGPDGVSSEEWERFKAAAFPTNKP